jgi:hypothetical protein
MSKNIVFILMYHRHKLSYFKTLSIPLLPIYATYPTHLILEFIILFDENYKL